MEQRKWDISENGKKVISLLRNGTRISFQRKGVSGNCSRGLTISGEAFRKMEDVTIEPSLSIEIDKNVFLSNYGNRVNLTKYCTTRDSKRCEGGFFYFTPKEWQRFFPTIRNKVLERIER